ncbi:hypothetical protein HPB51_014515 [Rhipicephalus microplus]|uniref:Uncharacterized protein n=1 Tax=Rhipicephalus microplus TaxID=6941 RepID=A0A9J6EGP0_RHIMP|nr:hypothetical protein HPB51_014515 [Rhipicephalus microplus]
MCSSWSAGEPARAKCRLVLSYVGTLRRRPRVPSVSPRYWAEQQRDEDVRIYRRPWGTGHHNHIHCRVRAASLILSCTLPSVTSKVIDKRNQETVLMMKTALAKGNCAAGNGSLLRKSSPRGSVLLHSLSRGKKAGLPESALTPAEPSARAMVHIPNAPSAAAALLAFIARVARALYGRIKKLRVDDVERVDCRCDGGRLVMEACEGADNAQHSPCR